MESSFIKAIGNLVIAKTNIITGHSQTILVPNIVTTVGKTYLAQRIQSLTSTTTVTPMQWMGLGTGTSANSGIQPSIGVADTILGYEVPLATYANAGGTASMTTRPTMASSTSSTNVITYVCTFPAFLAAGSIVTQSLTEAGIFNGDGATVTAGEGVGKAGTMLCHTAFAPVNKTWADAITITWNISIN